MTSTLSDLLGQAEVIPATSSAEEQVLAAALVIRHGLSIADVNMLHEMLGLSPEAPGRCPDCGGYTALASHAGTCAADTARRIMAITGSLQ